MMWASLDKLNRRLPDDAVVYCGHEYTLSNARFALSVDPDNAALKERVAEVERLRAEHMATLPTTMGRSGPPIRSCGRVIRRLPQPSAWQGPALPKSSQNCGDARTGSEP